MEIESAKLKFNSHKVHNPSCDILEYQIDKDTMITYGIYVNGYQGKKFIQLGTEFMEFYTGENYNTGSLKRSYSRCWNCNSIPSKYKNIWNSLKQYYVTNLTNIHYENLL